MRPLTPLTPKELAAHQAEPFSHADDCSDYACYGCPAPTPEEVQRKQPTESPRDWTPSEELHAAFLRLEDRVKALEQAKRTPGPIPKFFEEDSAENAKRTETVEKMLADERALCVKRLQEIGGQLVRANARIRELELVRDQLQAHVNELLAVQARLAKEES